MNSEFCFHFEQLSKYALAKHDFNNKKFPNDIVYFEYCVGHAILLSCFNEASCRNNLISSVRIEYKLLNYQIYNKKGYFILYCTTWDILGFVDSWKTRIQYDSTSNKAHPLLLFQPRTHSVVSISLYCTVQY